MGATPPQGEAAGGEGREGFFRSLGAYLTLERAQRVFQFDAVRPRAVP